MKRLFFVLLLFIFSGCAIHIHECESEKPNTIYGYDDLIPKRIFPENYKLNDGCNTCTCEGDVCLCTLLYCGDNLNLVDFTK